MLFAGYVAVRNLISQITVSGTLTLSADELQIVQGSDITAMNQLLGLSQQM